MTSKTHSFRPSPAMIISCVAMFLALTGSALAVGVGKNTVRSAQIVDGTVRTVDLGTNAVKAEKIAPDAVGAEEIAESAVSSPEVAPESLTSGDLGTASVTSSEVADQSLTANDLGPDSVGTSELAADSVGTSELVAGGSNGSVSVDCAAGEQVISGGGQPTNFGVEMTTSRPQGNGWLYQAKNNNGAASTITVYALCLVG